VVEANCIPLQQQHQLTQEQMQQLTQDQMEQLQQSMHVKFSPFVSIMGDKTAEELYGEDEESMMFDFGSNSNHSSGSGILSQGSFALYQQRRSRKAPSSPMPSHREQEQSSYGTNAYQQRGIGYSYESSNFMGSGLSFDNNDVNYISSSNNGKEPARRELERKTSNHKKSLMEQGMSSFNEIDPNWDAASSVAESAASEQQKQQQQRAPPAFMEQSFSVFSLLGTSLSTTASIAAAPPPLRPKEKGTSDSNHHGAEHIPIFTSSAASSGSDDKLEGSFVERGVPPEHYFPATEKQESFENEPWEEGEGTGEKFSKADSINDDEDKMDDEESLVSTSEHDEDPDSVDLAEEQERKTRRTLCFALLSALGIIALGQLLSRLLSKFFNSSGEDVAADAAADAAGDAVQGTAGTAIPVGSEQTGTLAGNAAAVGQTTQYVYQPYCCFFNFRSFTCGSMTYIFVFALAGLISHSTEPLPWCNPWP